MSDEKKEVPERWTGHYDLEQTILKMKQKSGGDDPDDRGIAQSVTVELIEELGTAEAHLAKSKQAFEDLRIADQATLTETLAAALEQSLRAEKAEAERDEARIEACKARAVANALTAASEGKRLRIQELTKQRDKACCEAVDFLLERDAARKQVQHLEDEQRVRRDVLEDRFPENWSAMSDEDMKEDAEYSETCKCFLCQWVRYELSRREQMIRICEQRDAAIELAAWKPITPEMIPSKGDEVGGLMGLFKPQFEVRPYEDYKLDRSTTFAGIKLAGWTHYRSINAPSIVADGEMP